MPHKYSLDECLTCGIVVKNGEETIAQGSTTDHCIHDLYVHTDYRRRGLGKMIVRTLVDMLGANWLWCKSDNEEAVALYNNLGFKIREIDDGYYKMSLEDD